MLHRSSTTGVKIELPGLNDITVLIDRSETELTEVALNSWLPGLVGPPHMHEEKEQLFYVLYGSGAVKIADQTFAANPGDFFYIPAGVVHQTNNQGGSGLVYLLFNAFLNGEKEGHASFAEHIERVKDTRKRQAETQQAVAGGGELRFQRRGAYVPGSSQPSREVEEKPTTRELLPSAATDRCSAWQLLCPPGRTTKLETLRDFERTIFVLTGAGSITVGPETKVIQSGDVIFVPRNAPHAIKADSESVTCLALDTRISCSSNGVHPKDNGVGSRNFQAAAVGK